MSILKELERTRDEITQTDEKQAHILDQKIKELKINRRIKFLYKRLKAEIDVVEKNKIRKEILRLKKNQSPRRPHGNPAAIPT